MFVLQLLIIKIINVMMTLLTNCNDILTLKMNHPAKKINVYPGVKNMFSNRYRQLLLFVVEFSGYIIYSINIFTLLYFYKKRPFVNNLLIKIEQFIMFACYNDLLIINLQICTFPCVNNTLCLH